MDNLTLKPCCKTLWTSMDVQNLMSHRDRISSLPNELISRILGFLPTKDVAAWSVCSKKSRLHFTCWLTSLDIDDSPISHCLNCPHLINSFPIFTKFVHSVLQACHSIEHLTRYRLGFGGDRDDKYGVDRNYHICKESCYPYLKPIKPMDLYQWMCFPLTHHVKELDLRIHVREAGILLPLEIFTCQTFEGLKLDVGLFVDDDDHPVSFYLPNLKLLHLHSVHFCNDDFVTRLVSSCPSLEDFALYLCWFTLWDVITICSPSLQRLVLDMRRKLFTSDCAEKNCELVLLDTPNLQYFHHRDNLAYQYSFTNMNALVTAEVDIYGEMVHCYNFEEASFECMLSLVRKLSNVQRLSLLGSCMMCLDYCELKDKLPVFHCLNYLELGSNLNKWDTLLVEFLNCSPFLETLAFAEGLSSCPFEFSVEQVVELEAQCWLTTQVPSCCKSCLKRIVIKKFWCSERELNLVQFLLRNASILEELVIICAKWDGVDPMSIESTLKKLPRTSITCSIRVQ